MPHLHLSLQAGDDLILKRMKRRHLRDDVINMCSRARAYRPDIAYGADIIAGFPTETEEMFQRTMDIVEECGLTFLHVFPYSEREGTPAARMPSVDKAIRKERAARLRGLGEKQVQKFLNQNIKKNAKRDCGKGEFRPHRKFRPVAFEGDIEAGSLIHVYTTGVKNNTLIGDVLSQ
jgi:threonylcarbamoyladenosine tRNA methylthiotransferase MtaB